MSTSIATTLGAGSGIDTVQLLADLVAANKAPKEAQIKTRETANTAQISTVANLASAIDSFASSLASLISGGSLFTQPTASDTAILTTSPVAGVALGNISAQIEVVQLATAQSLSSAAIPSAATPIGQGSLTLTSGKGAFTIKIEENNDSLSGLSAAINAAGAGVSASVVTDSSGSRLILRGTTGANQAFTLVPQDGADAALAAFAWNGSAGTGLSLAQSAQDAVIKLDGVSIARGTNSFDDVLPGVKIDLKKAAAGSLVTIGASRQTGALKQAVQDYVAAYNTLETLLDEATAPGEDGVGAGPLRGNAAMRDMRTRLSALTSMPLRSGDGPKTLAEIGVKTGRDGQLTLDGAKLDAALAATPDAVEGLFNPGQHSSSPLLQITSAMGKTKPGTYAISNVVPAAGETAASGLIDGAAANATGNVLKGAIGSPAAGLSFTPLGSVASAIFTVDLGLGGALQAVRDALRGTTGPLVTMQDRLKAESKSIAADREAMEIRADAYAARLKLTFGTMETRITALKATQSYMTQQIAMWNSDS